MSQFQWCQNNCSMLPIDIEFLDTVILLRMTGVEHNCMRVRNPRTTWQIFDYVLVLSRGQTKNYHNASDSVHFFLHSVAAHQQNCCSSSQHLQTFMSTRELRLPACVPLGAKRPGTCLFIIPQKRICQILTRSYYFCSTIVHQFLKRLFPFWTALWPVRVC